MCAAVRPREVSRRLRLPPLAGDERADRAAERLDARADALLGMPATDRRKTFRGASSLE
jgi:hypothetical protein